MKTWKENNWLSKLRESFERYCAESSELSRLEEARASDGSKKLKAENLAEFPKVFQDLFHLSSPELSSVEDDTDLTQAVILPQRFTAIEAALKRVVKSAIVCRKDCEEIASVFVDNLVETVINLYLKTAEDCIEYRRLWTLDKLNDNLDYRGLKKQEKTIEARYPYGHPEKKEKELAKGRGDYASLLPSLSFRSDKFVARHMIAMTSLAAVITKFSFLSSQPFVCETVQTLSALSFWSRQRLKKILFLSISSSLP